MVKRKQQKYFFHIYSDGCMMHLLCELAILCNDRKILQKKRTKEMKTDTSEREILFVIEPNVI